MFNFLNNIRADKHFKNGAEYLKNGSFYEAVAEFEKAVKLNPGHEKARISKMLATMGVKGKYENFSKEEKDEMGIEMLGLMVDMARKDKKIR